MFGLKLSILLLVGLLHIQKGESAGDNKIDMVEYYDKIDEYLSTKVQSDDIESNFAAAKEWMNELDKKSQKCFTFHRESKRAMKDALEQFLKLHQAVESVKCDPETLELVNANDLAAGEPRVNKFWSEELPERRIERIVYQLAKKHYDTCYPDSISPRVDQSNPTSLKYLVALGKSFIVTGTNPGIGRDFGSKPYLNVIRYLVSAESTDKDAGTENDEHYQVTQDDYEKFIVKPCEELKPLAGEYFSTELERRFLAYDMTPYDYDQALYKRASIQACAYLLKYEEQVWNLMLKSMKSEKAAELRPRSEPEKEEGEDDDDDDDDDDDNHATDNTEYISRALQLARL